MPLDSSDRVSAGLAAYASWAQTLNVLARPGGPVCVFTDFCEEAAVRGARLLASAAANAGFCSTTSCVLQWRKCQHRYRESRHESGSSKLVLTSTGEGCSYVCLDGTATGAGSSSTSARDIPVRLNPFRQPVSCESADNLLPSCSNGFMFGLWPE